MKQTTLLHFGDFKFDPANQCVWRGSANLGLTPKAFSVLDYLIANRSRLVTKEELLQQVWPDTFVSDAVLKVCVGEVRKVLGDDPVKPVYIETVHRRGYRFIAAAQEGAAPASARAASHLVGRCGAEAQLDGFLNAALGGQPHIVFITGDPGVGKSALAESFLSRVPSHVLVARGHALEQYGSGEPYMPVLEALTTLCRNERNPSVNRALEMHAPTWLAQMPALATKMGQAALQREVLGATRERMLREMAEAIEAITSEVPLILFLEDLHWSDHSTVDLISYLARRRAPVRLLLLGTYRPVDAILGQHPLKAVKQELELHRMCRELPLDFLSEQQTQEYIDRHLPLHDLDAAFTRLIHSRTDGNPLFVVTAIDFLKNNGSITERDGCWKLGTPLDRIDVEMPESLRDLIERQIGRVSSDLQSMLQAASIAGTKFSPASISFATELRSGEAEEMCEKLTRRGLFIRKADPLELPDGSFSAQYEFVHSLYRNTFYDLVSMGKRLRMHRAIGEGLEALCASQASAVAAELALHFEEGREYTRAATYLFTAAETASLRYAHREAIAYLNKARDLIGRLRGRERDDLEMAASERLGLTWRSMGEMRQAADDFGRMAATAHGSGRLDAAVRALLYRSSALSWFDRDECLRTADEALRASLQAEDPLLRAHTRGYCSYWSFLYTGWKDEYAEASLLALAAAEKSGNKGMLSLHVSRYSYFQCMHARYDDAVETASRAIAVSAELGEFFDHSMSQFYKGWALLHSGRWDELLRLLDEAGGLAERNEHFYWKTLFDLERAWLYRLCGSLGEAERLCRNAIEHVKHTRHLYTDVVASTLLGNILLDQHQDEDALHCLLDVAATLGQKRIVMDWIWEMPLRLGLADGWIRRGEYERAAKAAQRALTIAEQPREKTYMALALATLGEIAHHQGDRRSALEHAAAALDLVSGSWLPLAAERVFQVSAMIQGEPELMSRAAEVRERLARSLQTAPLLQRSFVSSHAKTAAAAL